MTSIKDIPTIWNPAGKALVKDEDFEQFVDEPVRAAVKRLNLDFGIQTNYSSANCSDGEAQIRIPGYALSVENLKLAEEKGWVFPIMNVWLCVSMQPEDDSTTISEQMLKLVDQFASQK